MEQKCVFSKIIQFCVLLFVYAVTINASGVEKIRFIGADLECSNNGYLRDVKFSIREMGSKFKISASFQLLKLVDADKVNMLLEVATSGAEKSQPIELNMNVCTEYKDQTLSKWQEIEKFGNITGCGIKKPGYYYIKDYVPDISFGDNLMVPEGHYQTKVVLKLSDEMLASIALDFKV